MNTDVQGRSTCPVGMEQWEHYTSNRRLYVQYDYRAPDGELFTCVAPSIAKARERRDEWLEARES